MTLIANNRKQGCFITLEGSEGVGKSTNLAFVQQWLEKNGFQPLMTREPGGTPMAEEIRELLLTQRDEDVSEKAELLLMFAARAQHLDEKILPELARGRCVVSDRFTDATYAYQGYARGLNLDWIAQLEQLVQETVRPDLTILLDLSTDVARQRMNKRGTTDRFEQEQAQFFDRVRQGYLVRAKAEPERFAVIDASQALEQVQQDIADVLQRFFDQGD
ncbi:dTMP kinase [Oceanospirillum linum]|uniref:Thymidylate kinase n=1 Tax=Oceanospirillum linum TaxID=966 RepID=A0A1T1HEG2_OCELI|nr:dTMP kinase [Oceanospirillum linum]OOV88251.1 dTMP kinase [Oceanospirillum linum]SEF49803.1 thymidylate kinase [Oleiphilus messinensis]SMP03657.1 dTMP kinase [Oceanospirillum linum]